MYVTVRKIKRGFVVFWRSISQVSLKASLLRRSVDAVLGQAVQQHAAAHIDALLHDADAEAQGLQSLGF